MTSMGVSPSRAVQRLGMFAVLFTAYLLSANPVWAEEQKAKVVLILQSASVQRWDSGDLLFRCKLLLQNNTGKELKVRSNFFSAFDGMILIVQDECGKELKQQLYIHHQSPMFEKKEYPLPLGNTNTTIVFPVLGIAKAQTKFKVKVVGTLPGSTYTSGLLTKVLEIEVKGR